jgi:hypothetical protein
MSDYGHPIYISIVGTVDVYREERTCTEVRSLILINLILKECKDLS